ncbi:MAG: excinuclease ABC subunit UvrC [Clostridiales Family XIII bacterium]|jgi:excinuclease ABC subunit C|nr:excinuclease ABC subunit UvrC [Clostridiales Family XIII bacterium]
MFDIQESLKNLPDKPGVYLHKDQFGEIIYVGKAASLNNRVRQYFQSARNLDAKSRAMVSHISEFEYITTNTEMEALILENNLIKKHMPRYNVLLRDDKTYPYIKITAAEYYPRILKTRIVANDGSRYFGPYADVRSVNQIIDLLCDVYRLKRCGASKFSAGHRPCLNRDINRCRGVCEGNISHEEYMEAIASVTAFLNGRDKELSDHLRERMNKAADELDFETAAAYRDYLAAASSIIEKQRVVLLSGGDIDIVLSARGETDAHVVVFFVREGRLSGRESHHLHSSDEDSQAEIVAAFLKQYYINQSHIPKEVLLDEAFADMEVTEAWMSELRGSKVRLYVPRKGEKKALLELAKNDIANVARLLDEKARTQREKDRAIGAAFAELLGIGAADGDAPASEAAAVSGDAPDSEAAAVSGDAPDAEATPGGNAPAAETDGVVDESAGERLWRVEAYDISNTGGVDSVGAMVVFVGAKPSKKDYRRFRIRTVEGSDDYSSMQEVIYRRFRRLEDGDAGFAELPDLILVDGGLGHVNAVMQVVQGMKVNVPVAGMVKNDKHRTRGLVYGGAEFELKSRPLIYHYIGEIQEEVHRFAIEYHRGLRNRTLIRSELDDIEKIGAKRRAALLAHFGSIDKIKAASEEELAGVPGMNKMAAAKVKAYFSDKFVENQG